MGNFFQGAGSALIGGALSGISNLFGAHSQNQSVNKQLAAADLIAGGLDLKSYL